MFISINYGLTPDCFTMSNTRLFYSVWRQIILLCLLHQIILLCLTQDYFTVSNARLFYCV